MSMLLLDRPEITDATRREFLAGLAAALEPDLVVGPYSGLTGADYGRLSRIAPTLAQPAEFVDYGLPWHEVARTLGLATGRAERAEALVAEVEQRFSRVRTEHPDLAGASALSFPTVLSTPFLLDGLVPRLAAAIDGDPATEVPVVTADLFGVHPTEIKE